MKKMWNKLKSAIEIPFDPSDENSYRENIFGSLINFGILIVTSLLIFGISLRGFFISQSYIGIAILIVMVTVRSLITKENVATLSLFLISLNWIVTMILFFFYENGLRAPGLMASIMFNLVYVGLMHGRQAVMIWTTFTIIVSVYVGNMEIQGVFLLEPKTPDIRFVLVSQIVFFPAVAFLVTRTLRNLKQSISLYREESEKRLRSEVEVKKLNQDLEKAYQTTLEGWAQALELRDKETVGHSRRVTELSMKLAERIGLSEEELKDIYYGALLHDIGKMGIPDKILNKPGPLTSEERAIVNLHPDNAYQLLKGIEYLQAAIVIPCFHHERWDGAGYPQGLKGEEIPLPARIFTIVDNWDALTSDRPYRDAWSEEKTIEYIQENRGIIFDRQIVDIFFQIVN